MSKVVFFFSLSLFCRDVSPSFALGDFYFPCGSIPSGESYLEVTHPSFQRFEGHGHMLLIASVRRSKEIRADGRLERQEDVAVRRFLTGHPICRTPYRETPTRTSRYGEGFQIANRQVLDGFRRGWGWLAYSTPVCII